ncbi:uncharacterized protein SCODWIG_01897 [Saccharomycodes ludwigii]|uniref:Ubiquitin-like protease family profile domain-containing protein n=1 Tax=Saccharomycodes ludwigii TaxID=36035 RepID=A0A376B605_9ASCO|nr:hypothetical protein SCDLUD_002455 [Saccharomycodes ludwigii]KAH3900990.1 hypothetical protein SCDLUD_002455 [Saccharomycodes ludwigii]SSD60136.1 uncharacterized protein SCODWIG_01897 [Saccharomycodes ludwigii]
MDKKRKIRLKTFSGITPINNLSTIKPKKKCLIPNDTSSSTHHTLDRYAKARKELSLVSKGGIIEHDEDEDIMISYDQQKSPKKKDLYLEPSTSELADDNTNDAIDDTTNNTDANSNSNVLITDHNDLNASTAIKITEDNSYEKLKEGNFTVTSPQSFKRRRKQSSNDNESKLSVFPNDSRRIADTNHNINSTTVPISNPNDTGTTKVINLTTVIDELQIFYSASSVKLHKQNDSPIILVLKTLSKGNTFISIQNDSISVLNDDITKTTGEPVTYNEGDYIFKKDGLYIDIKRDLQVAYFDQDFSCCGLILTRNKEIEIDAISDKITGKTVRCNRILFKTILQTENIQKLMKTIESNNIHTIQKFDYVLIDQIFSNLAQEANNDSNNNHLINRRLKFLSKQHNSLMKSSGNLYHVRSGRADKNPTTNSNNINTTASGVTKIHVPKTLEPSSFYDNKESLKPPTVSLSSLNHNAAATRSSMRTESLLSHSPVGTRISSSNTTQGRAISLDKDTNEVRNKHGIDGMFNNKNKSAVSRDRDSERETPINFGKDLKYTFFDGQTMRVTNKDFQCLFNSDWLNDSLTDFFMKYFVEQSVKNEFIDLKDVYVFSSFFYTKLLACKNDFDAVNKWVNNIDLSQKKYILLPINVNCHWFGCLVYNYAKVIRSATVNNLEEKDNGIRQENKNTSREINKDISGNDIDTCEEKGAQQKNAIPTEDTRSLSNGNGNNNKSQEKMGEETPGGQEQQTLIVNKDGTTDTNITDDTGKEKAKSTIDAEGDLHILIASEKPENDSTKQFLRTLRAATKKVTLKSKQDKKSSLPSTSDIAEKLRISKLPFVTIIIYDSLRQHHSNDIEPVKQFLLQYARFKSGVILEKSQLKINNSHVPVQPNMNDCGVHLIMNTKVFLTKPAETLQLWSDTRARGNINRLKIRENNLRIDNYFGKDERKYSRKFLRDELLKLKDSKQERSDNETELDSIKREEEDEDDIEIIDPAEHKKEQIYGTEDKKSTTEDEQENKDIITNSSQMPTERYNKQQLLREGEQQNDNRNIEESLKKNENNNHLPLVDRQPSTNKVDDDKVSIRDATDSKDYHEPLSLADRNVYPDIITMEHTKSEDAHNKYLEGTGTVHMDSPTKGMRTNLLKDNKNEERHVYGFLKDLDAELKSPEKPISILNNQSTKSKISTNPNSIVRSNRVENIFSVIDNRHSEDDNKALYKDVDTNTLSGKKDSDNYEHYSSKRLQKRLVHSDRLEYFQSNSNESGLKTRRSLISSINLDDISDNDFSTSFDDEHGTNKANGNYEDIDMRSNNTGSDVNEDGLMMNGNESVIQKPFGKKTTSTNSPYFNKFEDISKFSNSIDYDDDLHTASVSPSMFSTLVRGSKSKIRGKEAFKGYSKQNVIDIDDNNLKGNIKNLLKRKMEYSEDSTGKLNMASKNDNSDIEYSEKFTHLNLKHTYINGTKQPASSSSSLDKSSLVSGRTGNFYTSRRKNGLQRSSKINLRQYVRTPPENPNGEEKKGPMFRSSSSTSSPDNLIQVSDNEDDVQIIH